MLGVLAARCHHNTKIPGDVVSDPIILGIGGITIALESEITESAFDVPARFFDFYTNLRPDVRLSIHREFFHEWKDKSVRKIFDTGLSWSLFRNQFNWLLYVRSPSGNPYQLGVFADNYHSGDIFVIESARNPEYYNFPLGKPMGEIFMANLLARGYGISMHACGVIYNGNGLLFTGTSGSGKSTIAKLWQGLEGVKVVNDDRVIIRLIDEKFWLYGTPWHGQGGMALPDAAPLEKVFILKHGKKNEIQRLDIINATTALLVRSFAPLWDRDAMDFSLGLLGKLSGALPCYELDFVPDRNAVEFVRCLN